MNNTHYDLLELLTHVCYVHFYQGSTRHLAEDILYHEHTHKLACKAMCKAYLDAREQGVLAMSTVYESIHQAWKISLEERGFSYGEELDLNEFETPLFVPYDNLDFEIKNQDVYFVKFCEGFVDLLQHDLHTIKPPLKIKKLERIDF